MNWYQLANEQEVSSPAVLLFPERIRKNIDLMIRMAGDVDRLRPHVKTYKLRQVVEMQQEAGISRFKCATLSEAQMLGECQARDVLIAYPLYGPAQKDFIKITDQYPATSFSLLVDNLTHAGVLEAMAKKHQREWPVFVDLDAGMHRTGTATAESFQVFTFVNASDVLKLKGLHIYDGHLHHSDLADREKGVAEYFKEVEELLSKLDKARITIDELACGGSPTFGVHARRAERTLCPGTTLLWDHRYGTNFRDLPFLQAAVLLCRVISKTGGNRMTLDLGHKAVGSEMQPPRVNLLGVGDYHLLVHSEEHMVIETPSAKNFAVGDCIYGIPYHICPTMALHDFAWKVEDHKATEVWYLSARGRALNFK